MKEKKINDIFSTIQLEKDDDFELFAKSVGTSLYVDNTGNMLCFYSALNETRVVAFDSLKKEWYPLNKEEIDKLDLDKYILLSFEDSMKIYKDYPPFEALEFLKNQKAIERLKIVLKLRKTTPHRVIGWTDYVASRERANDVDDSYFAAVINDVAKHQYFFYGDTIDLVPVFEDNTYIDYSSRGWGDIIALSKNKAGDYDYSLYAWHGENYSGLKEPPMGFYEKLTIETNVDQEIYNYLDKYVANFYALTEEEMGRYYGSRYILLIDKCDRHDQIGTIKVSCGNNSLYFDVLTARYLNYENELDELIENMSDEFGCDILVNGDYNKIKERIKIGPALVVVLHI